MTEKKKEAKKGDIYRLRNHKLLTAAENLTALSMAIKDLVAAKGKAAKHFWALIYDAYPELNGWQLSYNPETDTILVVDKVEEVSSLE